MSERPKMHLQSTYIEGDLREWLIDYSYSQEMNPSSVIRKLLKQERERAQATSAVN